MVIVEHLSKLPHSNKASVSSNLNTLISVEDWMFAFCFPPERIYWRILKEIHWIYSEDKGSLNSLDCSGYILYWRIPRLRSEWSKTDIKQLEKKTKLSSLSQDLQYFPSSHRESSKFSFQFSLHFLLFWKSHITHMNHPSSFKPSPVYKTPLG